MKRELISYLFLALLLFFSLCKTFVEIPSLLYYWSIAFMILFSFDRKIKRREGWVISLVVLIVFYAFFIWGTKSALHLLITFLGYWGTYKFFTQHTIKTEWIIPFYFFILIPFFLVSVFWGPVEERGGNVPTLVPLAVNGFRVSTFPWGFTIHYTAALGLLFLLAAIYRWKSKIKINMIVLFLAVYFIVFSGSRATLICFLGAILLWWWNRKETKSTSNALVLMGFILCVYLIDALSFLTLFTDNSLLRQLVLKNVEVTSASLTSGRFWLWGYHWDAFIHSNFMGVGIVPVSFEIGDILPSGEIALAGSESYYTKMLAAFGWIGLVIPFYHIYLFYQAIKFHSPFLIITLFIIILSTVAGGAMFFQLYSFEGIFIWGLVFYEQQRCLKLRFNSNEA